MKQFTIKNILKLTQNLIDAKAKKKKDFYDDGIP